MVQMSRRELAQRAELVRLEGYQAALTDLAPSFVELRRGLADLGEQLAQANELAEVDPNLLKLLMQNAQQVEDRLYGKATTRVDARVQEEHRHVHLHALIEKARRD